MLSICFHPVFMTPVSSKWNQVPLICFQPMALMPLAST